MRAPDVVVAEQGSERLKSRRVLSVSLAGAGGMNVRCVREQQSLGVSRSFTLRSENQGLLTLFYLATDSGGFVGACSMVKRE